MPIAQSHVKVFALLRNSKLNWTYFSPPMSIISGQRTGKFRVSSDTLIKDEQGKNYIFFEDYAVALVDDLENPQYERARFTVGY